MKINKTFLTMTLIIIILLFVNFFTINKISQMSQKFDRYENTISALNDSIKITVNGAITEYSKKSPEIYLNELINSEYFQTLSQEQQEYYKELNKIKGLISATNAQLRKQGEIIGEILESQNPGIIDLDSNTISFELGTQLEFSEQDTSKALQWQAKLNLDRDLKFKMLYDYNVNILTTYERQKDKSIIVNYKIDDPELQITEMHNFIIPVEDKTKFQRFWDKNKNWIRPVGATILFGGGVATGIALSN